MSRQSDIKKVGLTWHVSNTTESLKSRLNIDKVSKVTLLPTIITIFYNLKGKTLQYQHALFGSMTTRKCYYFSIVATPKRNIIENSRSEG